MTPKKGEPYTAQEDNMLVREREAGRSFGEIAFALGRSPDSVRKRYHFMTRKHYLQEVNPNRKFLRAYTPDEDVLVLTYRRQGLTFNEIGKRLDRHQEGIAQRYYKLTETTPITRSLLDVRTDKETLEAQCRKHAEAVMKQGGFCAFSDNGNKATGLGICLPMIWPDRSHYQ